MLEKVYPLLSVVIYWHKPYAKNHALTFYQKTVWEILPTVYAEEDEPEVGVKQHMQHFLDQWNLNTNLACSASEINDFISHER